jgi:hypothetical protein
VAATANVERITNEECILDVFVWKEYSKRMRSRVDVDVVDK